jgi:hypothetical protein
LLVFLGLRYHDVMVIVDVQIIKDVLGNQFKLELVLDDWNKVAGRLISSQELVAQYRDDVLDIPNVIVNSESKSGEAEVVPVPGGESGGESAAAVALNVSLPGLAQLIAPPLVVVSGQGASPLCEPGMEELGVGVKVLMTKRNGKSVANVEDMVTGSIVAIDRQGSENYRGPSIGEYSVMWLIAGHRPGWGMRVAVRYFFRNELIPLKMARCYGVDVPAAAAQNPGPTQSAAVMGNVRPIEYQF